MAKVKIKPIEGWVLVTREDQPRIDGLRKIGEEYICWHELFDQRIRAIGFATKNGWPKPWKAVRGKLVIK
jgi:hypothetical protein